MRVAAAGVGSDSGHAVGLLGGQEEREFPVTLPEVVEDKEQVDDSDPYSTWHALYGTETALKVEFTEASVRKRGLSLCICFFISVISAYLDLNNFRFKHRSEIYVREFVTYLPIVSLYETELNLSFSLSATSFHSFPFRTFCNG